MIGQIRRPHFAFARKIWQRARNRRPVHQIARMPDDQTRRVAIRRVRHVKIAAHAQNRRVGVIAREERILKSGVVAFAHILCVSHWKTIRQRRRRCARRTLKQRASRKFGIHTEIKSQILPAPTLWPDKSRLQVLAGVIARVTTDNSTRKRCEIGRLTTADKCFARWKSAASRACHR